MSAIESAVNGTIEFNSSRNEWYVRHQAAIERLRTSLQFSSLASLTTQIKSSLRSFAQDIQNYQQERPANDSDSSHAPSSSLPSALQNPESNHSDMSFNSISDPGDILRHTLQASLRLTAGIAGAITLGIGRIVLDIGQAIVNEDPFSGVDLNFGMRSSSRYDDYDNDDEDGTNSENGDTEEEVNDKCEPQHSSTTISENLVPQNENEIEADSTQENLNQLEIENHDVNSNLLEPNVDLNTFSSSSNFELVNAEIVDHTHAMQPQSIEGGLDDFVVL